MKYAHRLFCHVWLLLYMFRMDKCISFVYILQGCFNGTEVIFRSSQCHSGNPEGHYGDAIKSVRASEITNLTIVYSTVYSGAKKTSKLHVTGLCEGNSPVTGEFPVLRACNAENVSIWWRHHDIPETNHWRTTTKHKKARTSCKIRGVYFVWVFFVNLREAACRILIRINVCDWIKLKSIRYYYYTS